MSIPENWTITDQCYPERKDWTFFFGETNLYATNTEYGENMLSHTPALEPFNGPFKDHLHFSKRI